MKLSLISVASLRLWQTLDASAGSSDEIPLVMFSGPEASADSVHEQLRELLESGAVEQLIRDELAALSEGRKCAGRFVALSIDSDGRQFLRVHRIRAVLQAWTARRELLWRELAELTDSLRVNYSLQTQVHDQAALAGSPLNRYRDLSQKSFDIRDSSGVDSYFEFSGGFGRVDRLRNRVAQYRRIGEAVALSLIGTYVLPTHRAAFSLLTPDEVMTSFDRILALHDEIQTAREQLEQSLGLEAGLFDKWILGIEPTIQHQEIKVKDFKAQLASIDELLKALARPNKAAEKLGREPISRLVQQEVWKRDQGRCVQCESQERLEYDHIIPISKGGSNTARNLQLLCEVCNRSKGDRI